jgi:predicted anti-sigma-YlaC factor YlaD
MTHKLYLDWMQLALDRELPAAQHAQLDEHLAECEQCATVWDALTQVNRLLIAEPLAAPRRGFTARFNARLAQQHTRPHVFWGALALGLGAVGAAALVVPVGLALLWSMVQVVGQPAASAALFSGMSATTNVLTTVAEALFITGRALAQLAVASPLAWAGALIALALTGVWFVMFRRLALRGLQS